MTWRDEPNDRGASAVEFALVSVLLLTLIFAIIQYGYFFFQSTAAESAAREGAREAAVGIDNCSTWKTLVEDRSGVSNYQDVTSSAAAARGDVITVTLTWARQDFGFPFVPFLGGGNQTETAVTRAERIGTVTAGCA
jgi:Flp pilus assembly protein TadG